MATPTEKLVSALIKLGWKPGRSGTLPANVPITEYCKGPMTCCISDVAVSYFFSLKTRPGINLWPLSRIRNERIFMLPKGASDKNLLPEERELRNTVLKVIR